MEVGRIIKNVEVLSEDHLPASVRGRDRELRELRECIAPALKQRKPMNVWLHGKPGTGKTLAIRWLLDSIKQESSVKAIYVNCWEHRTFYLVVDKIIREQKVMFAERTDAALKLERFYRTIGNKPFIVVLDEIDKPTPTERNAILYNLCRIGNLGLICICNSRYFLVNLDQRIVSRIALRQVAFKPYGVEDLRNILEERVREALQPASWTKEVLQRIAQMSDGDARVAIQTLKNAAELAEAQRSSVIKEEHIQTGYSSARELKQHYLLRSLTEHHRILFQIIKESGREGIHSGTLWQTYTQRCLEAAKKPLAERRLQVCATTLISLSLVEAERAPVRGYVRVFRLKA